MKEAAQGLLCVFHAPYLYRYGAFPLGSAKGRSSMNTVKSPSRNPLVVTIATAMLGAIAFVLMMLEFPLPLFVPYLKMDFGDVPAVLGAVLFGPWCGIAVELIKNLLEMLVRGLGTQLGFGNLQNFLIGCSYMLPLALIFRRSEKRRRWRWAAPWGWRPCWRSAFSAIWWWPPCSLQYFSASPWGPAKRWDML